MTQMTTEAPLSLSIHDASKLALVENFDIRIAQIEDEAKATEYLEARSIYDTILSSELNYTRDERDQPFFFFGQREIEGNWNTNLQKKLPTGTTVVDGPV